MKCYSVDVIMVKTKDAIISKNINYKIKYK